MRRRRRRRNRMKTFIHLVYVLLHVVEILILGSEDGWVDQNEDKEKEIFHVFNKYYQGSIIVYLSHGSIIRDTKLIMYATNQILKDIISDLSNRLMEKNYQVIIEDPYLQPFQENFKHIHQQYYSTIETLKNNEGGLLQFSEAYKRFGIHQQNGQVIYREWAPMAQEVYLYGEFNKWNQFQHKAAKDKYGIWELKFKGNINDESLVKAKVKTSEGKYVDRIPAWATYAKQQESGALCSSFYTSKYKFKHQPPQWDNTNLKIYECHIGMSGTEPKMYTYRHFRQNILDRIIGLGYNVIQMMAIAEHPYYGSFGYHVSNFFAPSSKFGSPDDLKQLVDYAHSKNVKVLIDLVHAHAVKNVGEGLNMWDGTDYHYFHSPPFGYHSQWDSYIFDYGKYEVQRFLLSNINYWMSEFKIDGYRFDGITSMIYKHHGINYGFTGNYNEYFNKDLDVDAVVYLMLANTLMKELNPKSISIAEDVSGIPGLGRDIADGGFGFDYRLAMAVPDMWIKLLKEKNDEEWEVSSIVHELTNRRWKEKVIGYCESHDQALVGDKTISMWLFDKDIYSEMSVLKQQTPRVFRGIALHKMIRLLTMSLAGEGYLNFMGNQFGHPEWIDFPRQGNNWSYHYCRRRWDLADDKNLRYSQLNNFDKQMITLENKTHFLSSQHNFISLKHDADKVLVFQKDDLLFVFNFHPSQSFSDYLIPCEQNGTAAILLDTDRVEFGGHARNGDAQYKVEDNPWCDRKNSFKLYLPSRSAIVFEIKQ